ncbi:MAG: glycerol dehydrogenase [Methanomassiliicoccales archaeon]|jgi:RPA family protein|nr:glycerol dehydrogenase [Methanomassiliicoccales archaeon]
MISREVAWRTFAAEYNASSLEVKGEGERVPSYVITPLGAMINRLFVVGVLTDIENTGTEEEPFWKARITDPTGTFYISAGQYQPEAAIALARIKPPEFIAVVGKSRTYSPEEGALYVSIRPEKVTVVDEKIRDYWILETCKSTLKRISAAEEARRMENPTVESLMKLGFSRLLSEGVVRSVAHYQSVDFEKYRAVVIDALRYLLPEYQMEIPETPVELPEEIDEEGNIDNIDNEEKVLAIIDRLDKKGKGAPWDEIVEEARKEGIEKDELEEITNSLLDKGMIYEPILGKMKRI